MMFNICLKCRHVFVVLAFSWAFIVTPVSADTCPYCKQLLPVPISQNQLGAVHKREAYQPRKPADAPRPYSWRALREDTQSRNMVNMNEVTQWGQWKQRSEEQKKQKQDVIDHLITVLLGGRRDSPELTFNDTDKIFISTVQEKDFLLTNKKIIAFCSTIFTAFGDEKVFDNTSTYIEAVTTTMHEWNKAQPCRYLRLVVQRDDRITAVLGLLSMEDGQYCFIDDDSIYWFGSFISILNCLQVYLIASRSESVTNFEVSCLYFFPQPKS